MTMIPHDDPLTLDLFAAAASGGVNDTAANALAAAVTVLVTA